MSARSEWSREFHQCGTNTPVNGRCVRPTLNRMIAGTYFVSFFLTINLTVVTSGPVRATGCKVRQRTVTPPGRPMPGSIPGSPTSFPNIHGGGKLRRSLPIGLSSAFSSVFHDGNPGVQVGKKSVSRVDDTGQPKQVDIGTGWCPPVEHAGAARGGFLRWLGYDSRI